MPVLEQTATRIGRAGHCGKDVRSDCRVTIEPTTSGGLRLEVKSRVDCYYGDSIRSMVTNILRSFDVKDAQVLVEDEGALPFALAARTEAAAKLAGYRGPACLPERVALPEPSGSERMRRSRLYLPGSEPKYFINAALHRPDAVILDLEDSVHPEDKFASRLLVRNALRAVDFGDCERMVRINQLPLGLDDLSDIVAQRPDLILIPKVESAHQVQEVDRRLTELEKEAGLTQKLWLMPIVESALGVENAYLIASASERVVALTIGLEDYTADLGVAKTRAGEETLFARMRLVNAARAAEVQAIDSVYGDVADPEGLRTWSERSRALGFEGMGCVHPAQIDVVHSAFSPTVAEIEKAKKIVAAFDESQAQGRAVISVGSKMIDPPVVQRALQVMSRARALRLIDTGERR